MRDSRDGTEPVEEESQKADDKTPRQRFAKLSRRAKEFSRDVAGSIGAFWERGSEKARKNERIDDALDKAADLAATAGTKTREGLTSVQDTVHARFALKELTESLEQNLDTAMLVITAQRHRIELLEARITELESDA